jgi:hypothetical protein
MAIITRPDPPRLADQAIRRVLYVGHGADEVCHYLTQHVGTVDVLYESTATGAIQQLGAKPFDVVVVDLREEGETLQLLLPLVSDNGKGVKLVVITALKNVGQYLAVPGVARVLAAPLREGQFLRVLGLQAKLKHFLPPQDHAHAEPSVAKPKSISANLLLAGLNLVHMRLMTFISVIYKRSATVLLLTLFSAFLFYGMLIAFFLLSSGWGAPMVLTQGHEMVNKAESQITELRVALSVLDQKITEAQFAGVKAERELSDGEVMMKYAADTAEKEAGKIKRLKKTVSARLARMERIRSALERQLAKDGVKADLDTLYSKRLINKKVYSSSTFGVLEASQRLAALESDIDALVAERENLDVSLEMLASLQEGLATGDPISTVTAASNELILLTKQALDAKGMFDNAYERISSTEDLIAELSASRQVVKRQITSIKSSALGRAISERIDVIFVPYTNRNQFQPGTKLYSCAFTVFICNEAGSVGVPLPGEVAGVHPFFGKPIRGYFVEARLKLDGAASQEIIHGGRKPFFF